MHYRKGISEASLEGNHKAKLYSLTFLEAVFRKHSDVDPFLAYCNYLGLVNTLEGATSAILGVRGTEIFGDLKNRSQV